MVQMVQLVQTVQMIQMVQIFRMVKKIRYQIIQKVRNEPEDAWKAGRAGLVWRDFMIWQQWMVKFLEEFIENRWASMKNKKSKEVDI